jgi:hypothetical protein
LKQRITRRRAAAAAERAQHKPVHAHGSSAPTAAAPSVKQREKKAPAASG